MATAVFLCARRSIGIVIGRVQSSSPLLNSGPVYSGELIKTRERGEKSTTTTKKKQQKRRQNEFSMETGRNITAFQLIPALSTQKW